MMTRTARALSAVLVTFLAALPLRAAAPEAPRWGLGLQAFWESYREETSTISSKADPSGLRIRAWAEGRLLARPARFEILLPVSESGDVESWYSGGLRIQQNSMDEARRNLRIELNPFPKAPQLWIGLLHEDVRQRRWAFDVPTSFDVAEEKIRSWWFECGWHLPFGPRKADGAWDPTRSRLSLSFGLPLTVETTNTVLPGFAVEDVDGLRLRFAADLFRKRDRSLRLAWDHLRWNGSDWQAYAGGFARWPRNETKSLSLEALLRF